MFITLRYIYGKNARSTIILLFKNHAMKAYTGADVKGPYHGCWFDRIHLLKLNVIIIQI
jgi:hypothetical protein